MSLGHLVQARVHPRHPLDHGRHLAVVLPGPRLHLQQPLPQVPPEETCARSIAFKLFILQGMLVQSALVFHVTFGRLDVVGAEDPPEVVPQLQVGRRAGGERASAAGRSTATAAVLVEGADDVGAVAEVGREGPVEYLGNKQT